MLTYNLDIEQGSLWLRTTPTEFALKQPYYCTEAGIFYAREKFNTARDYKDSYLLFYTLEGCGIIEQNEQTIYLPAHHALFLNCRKPQSYYTDPQTGKWTHYWVHFDGSGISSMEELLTEDNRIAAIPMGSDIFTQSFDTLLQNLEKTNTDTILTESLLVHQLLTDMIIHRSVSYSANQSIIMQSADYIKNHFAEPINLQMLLDLTHMSKAYYMRLFRQYIGTTPYKYMLTMRMNKAREYLELTDMTIHEIALKTGFQDDASFSTRFSSMIGMSPLKYRKEAITRKQVYGSH